MKNNNSNELSMHTSKDANSIALSGNTVKISEVLEKIDREGINIGDKTLSIFGHDSVYFDTNLNNQFKGKNIAIIAPEWELDKSISINLSGESNVQYPDFEEKAKDGEEVKQYIVNEYLFEKESHNRLSSEPLNTARGAINADEDWYRLEVLEDNEEITVPNKDNYIKTGELGNIIHLKASKNNKDYNFISSTKHANYTSYQKHIEDLKAQANDQKFYMGYKELHKASGANGHDGIPGLPGNSGGNLLGISNHITGLEKLSIVSEGGRGGNGQNGGNGDEGIKGEDAQSLEKDTILKERNYSFLDLRKSKYYMKEEGDCLIVWGGQISIKFKNEGKAGEKGGNGGLGGKGGKGGLKGDIYLTTFKEAEEHNFNKTLLNGFDGRDGYAGEAGLGGIHGSDSILYLTREPSYGGMYEPSPHWTNSFQRVYSRAESGSKSTDLNSADIKDPVPIAPIKNHKIITDYLFFSLNNFELDAKDYDKIDFLSDLILSFKAQQISDLTYRAIAIQHNIISKTNDKNYLKIFNNFEHQILDFYQDNKSIISKNHGELKVLDYLYANNKSSASLMKSLNNDIVVVDITKYFKSAAKYAADLKILKQEQLVRTQKERYETNLKSKINDTSELIKKLSEDVKQYKGDIGKKIFQVVDEIEIMKAERVKRLEEIKHKIEELENLSIIQTILGIFNVFCKALSFLGPVGAVVGTAGSFALDVGSSFVTESAGPSAIEKIPGSINALKNDINTLRSTLHHAQLSNSITLDKEAALMDLYNEEKYESERNGNNFQANKNSIELNKRSSIESYLSQRDEISEKICSDKLIKQYHSASYLTSEEKEKIKEREEFDENTQVITREIKKTTELEIKNLENKFRLDEKTNEKEFLQKERRVNKDFNKQKQELKSQKVIDTVHSAVETGAAIVKVVNTKREYNSKIAALKDEFQKTNTQIEQLQLKEKSVLVLQNNLMKNLSTSLSNFEDRLGKDSSHAKLIVQKLEIKNYLEDLKDKLHESFEGFKAEPGIINIVKRLEGVMKTLIDIYDNIQDFNDQIEFANYIGDMLSTEDYSSIPSEYREDMSKLKLNTLLNVTTDIYNKAKHAFEQWAFPYFEDYKAGRLMGVLPDEASICSKQQTKGDLIDKLQEAIAEFKNIVDQENAVINHRSNETMVDCKFSNEKDSNFGPFFTWGSNDYPFEIKQLLSLQPVVLHSNAEESKKYVVKFTKIYINIESKTRNSDHVNDTLSILKNYNVTLIHQGNSEYKFKDKDGSDQIITFNPHIAKKDLPTFSYPYDYYSKNPTHAKVNQTVKKLEDKATLSPYATWTIKLEPITSTPEFSVKELQNLLGSEDHLNDLKVHLVGEGQYIEM